MFLGHNQPAATPTRRRFGDRFGDRQTTVHRGARRRSCHGVLPAGTGCGDRLRGQAAGTGCGDRQRCHWGLPLGTATGDRQIFVCRTFGGPLVDLWGQANYKVNFSTFGDRQTTRPTLAARDLDRKQCTVGQRSCHRLGTSKVSRPALDRWQITQILGATGTASSRGQASYGAGKLWRFECHQVPPGTGKFSRGR